MQSFPIALLLVSCAFITSARILETSDVYSDINILSRPKLSPLLDLHKSLCTIESITPNEHDVGNFLVKYLKKHNLTVSTQEVDYPVSLLTTSIKKKPRFNIHAYAGKNRKTRTLVSSHIDTVPPFWPYEYRANNTEIWGRGTVDAKGAVAAQIIAYLELRSEGKLRDDDTALLFVVDEESGGSGMRKVNELGLTWNAVVFGEPTENKLATGHKGIMGFKVKAHGKAAHSGYPWLGSSANEILIAALVALEKLSGTLPSSEKYGETTINIGKIEGGVAANVVAQEASALISMRLAAGTPAEIKPLVLDAMQKATEQFVSDGGSIEVDFPSVGYPPVDTDHDIDGFDTITVNYGTDVPNLEGDHKRYLYGPGSILVAHSDHEHLTIDDLEKAVVDYKKIILAALKNSIEAAVEL